MVHVCGSGVVQREEHEKSWKNGVGSSGVGVVWCRVEKATKEKRSLYVHLCPQGLKSMFASKVDPPRDPWPSLVGIRSYIHVSMDRPRNYASSPLSLLAIARLSALFFFRLFLG